MPSLAHICAGGFAVVLLTDYVTLPAATWLNPDQQSIHAPAPTSMHAVDRTRKGDRLLPSPRDSGASKVQPAPAEQTRPHPQRIPVGCDPVFSPLTGSTRANFTGRCLADGTPAPRIVATLG
jgi:hypothetical protein